MKQSIKIDFEVYEHYQELSEQDQKFITLAYQAAEKAYAPYSRFHVGASLEIENGACVLGSNQENIAYPSGLCAERVALFAHGATNPDIDVKSIFVVAKGDLIDFDSCVSPCGSCRQVMAESERRQSKSIRIVLVAQSGKTWIFNKVSDLLVFPFGVK